MRHIMYSIALAAGFLLAPAAYAETAVFAGGCFWCVEKDMDHVKGVTSTVSGFAGGTTKNPSYQNHEGFTEAVQVEFDPAVISYEALTAHFLRTIDVVDGDGQFCDRGPSYIPALFPLDEAQAKAAKAALDAAAKDLNQPVAVKLGGTANFYPAEDYHQNYYQGTNSVVTRFGIIKQSEAYAKYRKGCGRDARVKALWGDKAFTFPVGGAGT